MYTKRIFKRLSVITTTLICCHQMSAQWMVTEPTDDFQGELRLSSLYQIRMDNGLSFNGAPKENGSYIRISPMYFTDNTNILHVSGGKGAPTPRFVISSNGDITTDGIFQIGFPSSATTYPTFFQIEKDSSTGCHKISSKKGPNGYPLTIFASQANFESGIKSFGTNAGIVINRGSDGNQGAQLTISPQPEDTNFDEWYYAITAKGYKGPVTTESDPFHPLLFEAKSFKFNTGNIHIDGQIEKVKRIGIGSATANDNALVNMEAYMTSAEYFILGSHYNAAPFYVKTNGEMKTGNLIEMGSTKGGHLLINSYDNFATSFSNVSDGNTYHPMSFYASKYNFNLSAGKDTMHIIGGVLSVDGTITCKDQLKVAEIDADQIKTKDINVEMNQAADYVFDEQYNLQPLNEVESYVKSNKHLPGIPSATEMAQEGMSVSKMSNLLLEKVEELTLHMIQMQKEMNQLREENNALKSEVQELRNK